MKVLVLLSLVALCHCQSIWSSGRGNGEAQNVWNAIQQHQLNSNYQKYAPQQEEYGVAYYGQENITPLERLLYFAQQGKYHQGIDQEHYPEQYVNQQYQQYQQYQHQPKQVNPLASFLYNIRSQQSSQNYPSQWQQHQSPSAHQQGYYHQQVYPQGSSYNQWWNPQQWYNYQQHTPYHNQMVPQQLNSFQQQWNAVPQNWNAVPQQWNAVPQHWNTVPQQWNAVQQHGASPMVY